jgi:hypothetical protein
MEFALLSRMGDLQTVGTVRPGHHYTKVIDTVVINGHLGNLESVIQLLKTKFQYVLYVPSHLSWSTEEDICKEQKVVYGNQLLWIHPQTKCNFLLCTLSDTESLRRNDHRWILQQLPTLEGPVIVIGRATKKMQKYFHTQLALYRHAIVKHTCFVHCFFGCHAFPRTAVRNFNCTLRIPFRYCCLDDCAGYATGGHLYCPLHKSHARRYIVLHKSN